MYNDKKSQGDIMLKAFRNKQLMKIVMWSLVVIFAAWGIGSVTMSGKSYAGTIFGKRISLQDYNRSYSAVLSRAQMIYGEQLPKIEKFLNLRSQAWDRLILLHTAKKRHLRASNKEVIQRIASLPFFQRNGTFDKNLYNYIAISVLRTTPRDFEESVRGDIIIDKLINLITKDITLVENEIKQAYIQQNELADISFIILKSDDYTSRITAEDTEIQSFYNNNKVLFLSPATANAIYVEFPFYENKENARFAADEIRTEVRKGSKLNDISKKYALELKETGDFPLSADIAKTGLPYPLVLACFGLEQGQVSEVIEDEDRFYVLEVKSKAVPRQLTYEQAKKSAEDMFIKEKASSVAYETAENVLKLLQSDSSTLESIAQDLKHNVLKANNISRKSHVEQIGNLENFSNQFFSINVNETAGPIKTHDGFAIIRLDSITPVDDGAYEKDKAEFSEKLMQENKNKAFQKWFTELKQKANLRDNL
jgi:parvulin-like peptidyl-prolyl isomerase